MSQSKVIFADDAEELSYSVWPWDLRMRQLSNGQFRAHLDCVEWDGMLLTRERWARSVGATGATPKGYIALCGCCTERSFRWCGEEVSRLRIACGIGASETDFLTPVNADHWTILVPRALLADHLGDEAASGALTQRRVVTCTPSVSRRMPALVKRAIRLHGGGQLAPADVSLAKATRADLLDSITTILIGNETGDDVSTPRSRYLYCQRAIRQAEKKKGRISVQDLADATAVSRRTLELAFHETLNTSPHRFLIRVRLNGLHQDLRAQGRSIATVTQLAHKWGFTELGRTAVEYKRQFGESPSATLATETRTPDARLADMLATGAALTS